MPTAFNQLTLSKSPNEKHKIKLRDVYPFASNDDLENEQDTWKTHRVGSTYRQSGRRAGHAFHNFTQENDERDLDRDRPRDQYLNVREFMKTHPNEKLMDPQHHADARFRLEVTEDYIKKGQFGKDGGDEDDSDKKDGKKDDKKGSTGQNDSKNENKDGSADASKDSEGDKEDKGKEPTPEEKHEAQLAQEILEEIRYMSSLQDNDGKSHAPIPEQQLETRIDEADQFGPDNWIPRSASLIRLTGKHPLNAQPQETELYEAGLITPTRLHYVRNHGSVPHLDWKTHTLQVFSDPPGLLQENEYNMDQIAAMQWINIPVTIACDGNRRKEVNLVQRSKGFNWGSGGISCVFWKGVLVRDLLLQSGVAGKPKAEQWHVHFEGAEDLHEDKYATSISFDYIMDPLNDVMLAYEMNDRPLHPDHGYPIRLIVPGWVGGRMVKWLKKIWISKKESTNYHHLYDNRVLPSFITENDSALAQAFWHHPDTRCNEQSLQSIICEPAQGELIDVSKVNDTYRIAGFAMAGGGNRVQRVEISIDGGTTWLYCFRRYPDKPVRHEKKYWTWCHWHRDVPIRSLLNSPEVIVRAWDVYKNVQPEHLTFNIMGMMNNCWYRVKFELFSKEKIGLFCRHPVEAVGDGGWMKPSAEQHAASNAQDKGSPGKQFTSEEVEKHNKEDDAWIVINNKVYDVTSVLSWHPGGKHAILAHAGMVHMETTSEYSAIHDDYANKKAEEVCVGSLSDKAIKALKDDAERLEKEKKAGVNKRKDFALQEHQWTAVKLIERKEISNDTRVYKFALPQPAKLGLPVGKHVQVGIHFQDKMVIRSYTPVSPVLPSEEDGTLSLLIKTYFPDDSKDAKFPPGGTASNYLDMLEQGEEIDIKGPQGEIEYQGRGKFIIEGKERSFKRITMVAGGSGITPHYQLVHAIVKDTEDDTKINLLYGNKSIDDVLMLEDLQKLEKQGNGKFKLWNVLSHPPQKWTQGSGHIDEDDIKQHGFEPSNDSVALLCGPPPMTDSASKILKEWGYKDDENLFGF